MDAWHESEPYDWQQDAVSWEAGNRVESMDDGWSVFGDTSWAQTLRDIRALRETPERD